MKGKCSEINQISRTDNILRDLGLKCSIKGTTLINKAIQFVIISSEESIIIDNIYEEVANYYKNIFATFHHLWFAKLVLIDILYKKYNICNLSLM